MPHPVVYPGLWLWDSCFHSLIWSALGDADRAVRELQAVFATQTPQGFVPHMSFGRDGGLHPDLWQTDGPSTITQPPMYGHAVAALARAGTPVDTLTGPATRALWYLFDNRAAPCGLLRIFHPWESGTDDSPRWASWQDDLTDRQEWWRVKGAMVRALQVEGGAAMASDRFDVCPAGWNALVAWNAAELASLTGDIALAAAADQLARRLDELAWDEDSKTWADTLPRGETGSTVRTGDALLGVLTTPCDRRAAAAFRQLTHPDHFGTRFGPAGVHPHEPSYDPGRYWRGGAWPPLDYLFRIAADRRGRRSLADRLELVHTQASRLSGYSEYRHPHTGRGLGAAPHAWGFLPLVPREPDPRPGPPPADGGGRSNRWAEQPGTACDTGRYRRRTRRADPLPRRGASMTSDPPARGATIGTWERIDPDHLAQRIKSAADRLEQATTDRVPCRPVRDLLGPDDLDGAYQVQRQLTARALARGRRVVGRKIGLTSPKVQAQLGVDQPDFGVLFDDMALASGSVVEIDRLLQPRIEAEVAFVLAHDLDGEVTPEAVRKAVDHAVVALEIVDSRIAGWDISITDTVADNASSALFVLGDAPVPLEDRDLRPVEMEMVDRSGAAVSEGLGRDCLGDPVLALVWLAETAKRLGSPLQAGDVILSGAFGPMVPVVAGSSFTATFSGLGSVTTHFSEGGPS
jgi:2-keto-4-pentenoate hydratase